MIELTFNTAFMMYLASTLIILLGIWCYSNYRGQHREAISNEHKLFVCEYCHFAYLEKSFKKVHQCPQCQSFNKEK